MKLIADGTGGDLWLAGEGAEAPSPMKNAYAALSRTACLTVHPHKGATAVDRLLAKGSRP